MYFLFYGVINNFIRTIYGVIDLDRVFPTSLVVPPRTGSQSPNPIIEEPDYSNSRIMLIKSTLEIFKNNFVVGVGIGNVTTKMYLLNGLSMNSHNLFLQLLAESGILILFTLLIFGYYVINLIIKTKSKSRFFFIVICIVVGIEAMFNHNILNINIIWVTLAFFLAMIVIHAKEQKVFIMNRSTFRKKHRNLY
jgi:O-antigen ligase